MDVGVVPEGPAGQVLGPGTGNVLLQVSLTCQKPVQRLSIILTDLTIWAIFKSSNTVNLDDIWFGGWRRIY